MYDYTVAKEDLAALFAATGGDSNFLTIRVPCNECNGPIRIPRFGKAEDYVLIADVHDGAGIFHPSCAGHRYRCMECESAPAMTGNEIHWETPDGENAGTIVCDFCRSTVQSHLRRLDRPHREKQLWERGRPVDFYELLRKAQS